MTQPQTDVASARAKLLELIKAKAIVHGQVTLSSGRMADYYVDLRRISLDGEAAPLVGIVMRDLTRDLGYEAVGYASQLEHLLAEPGVADLLAAAPAAQRVLNPIRHMLGVGPAPHRPSSRRPRDPRPVPEKRPTQSSLSALGGEEGRGEVEAPANRRPPRPPDPDPEPVSSVSDGSAACR